MSRVQLTSFFHWSSTTCSNASCKVVPLVILATARAAMGALVLTVTSCSSDVCLTSTHFPASVKRFARYLTFVGDP